MLQRIKQALDKAPISGTVTVLPDYFVDRFVRVDDFDELVRAINQRGREGGGGSVRGIKQAEVKGGNAVNLAYSLGALHVKTNLITIANSLAAEALSATFRKLSNVNLDIIDGDPGYTVAIEFVKNGRMVNVMVSDGSYLTDFDHTKLDEKHWNWITGSDLVCLVNWSAMRNGTDLTEAVFSKAKEKGIRTFFDPADVYEKSRDIPDLRKRVLDKGLIDYFSLNENEARIVVKELSGHKLAHDYTKDELKKTISILADFSGEIVDIHAARFSASCHGNEISILDCHRVEQKTITGAGDVWDAGDIIGYNAGLEVEDRLALANGAAGLFVSREHAVSPDKEEILGFLNQEYGK